MGLFSIDGLISGLDTTDIIARLGEIDRAPISRLKRRQDAASGQLQAWQAFNTRLLALRDRARALARFDTYRAVRATVSEATILAATASSTVALGTFTITVDRLAAGHQTATGVVTTDSSAQTFGTGVLTIQVGTAATDVTIDSTSNSLTGIAQAINGAGAGVVATVLEDTDGYRLVLSAISTGASSQVTVADGLAGGTSSLGAFVDLQPPQDARVILGSGEGALTVTRPSNVITDLIPNVTLALGRTGGPVTLTIARDPEAVVRAVTDFVSAYNGAVDLIAQYTRYDAESRVAGVLLGDGTMQRVQLAVSATFLGVEAPDNATLKRLNQIGMTLGRDGRLALDAARLRQIINEKPAEVQELLKILGQQMDAQVNPLTRAGGILGGVMERIRNQIADFERRITVVQVRAEQKRLQYVREFTALERALATLQTQNAWLRQQLLGLSRSAL